MRPARAVKSSVPGSLAAFAAAPNHDGIRNGIAELALVVAGFCALGKGPGLRR